MIAPHVVTEVRRLLADGKLSQRKIAKALRVSRGTVGAIASGRRPDYPLRRSRESDESSLRPTGPPRRCPGCGGMVYLPCRVCQTRESAAVSTKPPIIQRLGPLEVPLGLDLRPADRRRYEEVRARRLAAESEPGGAACDVLEPDDEMLSLDPADLWDALEYDGDEPEFDDSHERSDDEIPLAEMMRC